MEFYKIPLEQITTLEHYNTQLHTAMVYDAKVYSDFFWIIHDNCILVHSVSLAKQCNIRENILDDMVKVLYFKTEIKQISKLYFPAALDMRTFPIVKNIKPEPISDFINIR